MAQKIKPKAKTDRNRQKEIAEQISGEQEALLEMVPKIGDVLRTKKGNRQNLAEFSATVEEIVVFADGAVNFMIKMPASANFGVKIGDKGLRVQTQEALERLKVRTGYKDKVILVDSRNCTVAYT